MFSKNTTTRNAIDPDQKEMIENARLRIKQKRGLFTHFMLFLIGSVALIFASQVLLQDQMLQFLGIDWWIWVILLWFLVLMFHAFNVFITKRILGPGWEKKQYEKLVQKQMDRIDSLQTKIDKTHPLPLSNSHALENKNSRKVTMIAAAGDKQELGIK